MSNELKYYKPFILFFGVALTTFGMFVFGYFMGMMDMGGERKLIGIVLSLLVWYIGVLFLCEAGSYKSKGGKRK